MLLKLTDKIPNAKLSIKHNLAPRIPLTLAKAVIKYLEVLAQLLPLSL